MGHLLLPSLAAVADHDHPALPLRRLRCGDGGRDARAHRETGHGAGVASASDPTEDPIQAQEAGAITLNRQHALREGALQWEPAGDEAHVLVGRQRQGHVCYPLHPVLDAEKPVLGAEPYVGGTLLAAQWGMDITGLVRGLDRLLFAS